MSDKNEEKPVLTEVTEPALQPVCSIFEKHHWQEGEDLEIDEPAVVAEELDEHWDDEWAGDTQPFVRYKS